VIKYFSYLLIGVAHQQTTELEAPPVSEEVTKKATGDQKKIEIIYA
jgi:hypothetical protein